MVISAHSTLKNAGRKLESLIGKNVKIRENRGWSLGNKFVLEIYEYCVYNIFRDQSYFIND